MQLFDRGSRDTPNVVTNRIVTVPNALSLARLLILPYLYGLIVGERYLLGLLVGFVFGASDWFDGYVARRFDQVTRLGQLLDPISDRLFIITLMVALVVADVVPLALAVAIVARDVLLLLGGALLVGRGAASPPVTYLGKAATFGLMWSFPWLLVGAHLEQSATGGGRPWAWVTLVGLVMAWVATALYWWVGIGYARTVLAGRSSTVPDEMADGATDPADRPDPGTHRDRS